MHMDHYNLPSTGVLGTICFCFLHFWFKWLPAFYSSASMANVSNLVSIMAGIATVFSAVMTVLMSIPSVRNAVDRKVKKWLKIK
jgi:hypothetical protein